MLSVFRVFHFLLSQIFPSAGPFCIPHFRNIPAHEFLLNFLSLLPIKKSMKKLLVLILPLAGFIVKPAVAQDCTYFKQGTVKATGEPFKESRNVLVKTYAFQLRKEGTSKLSCSMDISIPGTSGYSITPKDTLYLNLENEEVVKLVPDKVYAPAKKAAMNGMTSQYLPTYGMPKEVLQKLAASLIVKVRLSLEKPIDGATKKTEAQAIMKMAGCMLVE